MVPAQGYRDFLPPRPPDAPGRVPRRDWPPVAQGLAIFLSLTIALALIGVVFTLRGDAPATDLATPRRNARQLEQLAAALNHVLAGADAVVLDALLAPDVAIQVPDQPPGGRQLLLDWLAGLRAGAPGARIVLSEVVAHGGGAVARLTVGGGAPMVAGGALIGAPAMWEAAAFVRMHAD